MTLLYNYDSQLPATSDFIEHSSTNLKSLYCSHLWSNDYLRQAIINGPLIDNKVIKYCSTCRGKIRNYEVKSPKENFLPTNYSTPIRKSNLKPVESDSDDLERISHCDRVVTDNVNFLRNTLYENEIRRLSETQCIPTISGELDSSVRHKFRCTSYNTSSNSFRQNRLSKSLKGIGCIVNFTFTESPVKKRTQIQVCSISIMIVAILIISLVLVNFTSLTLTNATDIISTNTVPTRNVDFNNTSFATASIYSDIPLTTALIITELTTTTKPFAFTTNNVSNIIAKIRKNIKTYPKDITKGNIKPKDEDKDVSQRFCSCQKNEVCMLEESTGTSVCKQAVDSDDPTGCGGLCALETEACHLVDKVRGVRVCRLLSLVTCSPQEWRCRNGFCITADARCDGIIQCYDRSDEINCECDLSKQFHCGQLISCFSNTKICDGVIDCWDGLDEVNCTTECPEEQFTCTNGQCILSSRFCDGLMDCSDGSDEPKGCEGACSAHELQCKNSRCIPHTSRCDGKDDCGDNTDELRCS